MCSEGATRAPRCPSIHICAEVPNLSDNPSYVYLSRTHILTPPFFFLVWSYSPHADEALGLLSLPLPPSKPLIEQACKTFLDFGVGPGGAGWVIIRSGELGAFIACRSQPDRWIDPYWTIDERVVDVTGKFLHEHILLVWTRRLTCGAALAYECPGAGNSFLGGLAAGLALRDGDVYEGT